MLSGISRKHSIRSSTYWFTEFCNSQCLSHFAAPFIVVRAETSVAESCKKHMHRRSCAVNIITGNVGQRDLVGGKGREDGPIPASPTLEFQHGGRMRESPSPRRNSRRAVHGCLVWMRANDPSAGSPTETLLRLLLPLSDEVH